MLNRTISSFLVRPAVYGGFGIFAQGTQSTDDGPETPFQDLFAVGSDADEAGVALTEMLAKIGPITVEAADPTNSEEPA